MDFSGALIFAAAAIESIAQNRLTHVLLGVAALLIIASFLLGEDGAGLRHSLARVFAFGLIGGLGAITILSVKGAPPTVAKAPPVDVAEQRIDRWIDRIQRSNDAAPSQPAQGRLDDSRRPRDLAAERREHLRVRAEVARIPEAARTPEQRRREADAIQGLAGIDRDEGRIQEAIERYRSAQALYARLSDVSSKSAAVGASLDLAEALDVRNDEGAARATYRSAIADQRGLVELPERERREGIAVALVRYAKFETGRRQEQPARAALDEADDHFVFLRAQRGKLQVLRARAELGLALGDVAAARHTLVAMRVLTADPALAASASEADMVEARIELAEGNARSAYTLFVRAATGYRRAGEGATPRRALAVALLGQAEAAFAAHRERAGRESAAAAIQLWRALGERAKAINAMVQLALWEAAAGDAAAARDMLTLAHIAQRETGEARPIPDTAA
ncbi:MAG: hypothetical protein ACREIP_10575, partial [Alphaproteobacteria bacterium]